MTVLHVVIVNATVRDSADVAVRQPARDLRPEEIASAWCRDLIADLFETLYGTPGGIGLAAPQVGVLLRLAVIDLRDGGPPRVLINPSYRAAGDERETADERCLSVPDFAGEVSRPRQVEVNFLDHRGIAHQESAADFPARVMQHEIDHLDGILCIDRVADKSLVRPESGGYPARQAQRTTSSLFDDA
jgi:peptide deformylase